MKFNLLKLTSVAVIALTFGLTSCQDFLEDKEDSKKAGELSEAGAYPGSGTTPCASIEVTQNLPVVTVGNASAPTPGQDFIINSSVTWTSDKIWTLYGTIRVQAPAVLTIEAGTLIKGDKFTIGSLVIEPGAKIFANGTITNPIVMTSNEAEGSRVSGDWGGLAVLGNALVNTPSGTALLEGFSPTAGIDYGGTNNEDNSGSLRFLRIEYAGRPLTTDNEKNSLTLAGVGCNTRIDHVFVSYANDDAFEWFGGSVSSKFLFAYGTQDDDFDSDFGFSGVNQFLIGYRLPEIADVSGSNGIESDGSNECSASRTTTAIFSHVTLVGPDGQTTQAGAVTTPAGKYNAAINVRRNTGIDIHNSVVVGWGKGVDVDDQTTSDNLLAGCPDACPAGKKPLRYKNNTIYKLSTYASTFATFGTTSSGTGCGAVSNVVACLTDPSAPNYNFNKDLTDLNSLGKWKTSLWNRSCPNLSLTDYVSAANPGSELLSYDGTATARPLGTNVANICQPACTGVIGAINPTSFFRGAKGAFDNGWKYNQGWLSFTPQTNNYK